MKKCLLLPLFCLIFLAGCDVTPEEKTAIHEGALTSKATAQDFDAIKNKLQAKDPNDESALQQWIGQHSASLNAAAAAMADVDQRVNAKMLAQLAAKDLKAKQDAKKKISFAPGK